MDYLMTIGWVAVCAFGAWIALALLDAITRLRRRVERLEQASRSGIRL